MARSDRSRGSRVDRRARTPGSACRPWPAEGPTRPRRIGIAFLDTECAGKAVAAEAAAARLRGRRPAGRLRDPTRVDQTEQLTGGRFPLIISPRPLDAAAGDRRSRRDGLACRDASPSMRSRRDTGATLHASGCGAKHACRGVVPPGHRDGRAGRRPIGSVPRHSEPCRPDVRTWDSKKTLPQPEDVSTDTRCRSRALAAPAQPGPCHRDSQARERRHHHRRDPFGWRRASTFGIAAIRRSASPRGQRALLKPAQSWARTWITWLAPSETVAGLINARTTRLDRSRSA